MAITNNTMIIRQQILKKMLVQLKNNKLTRDIDRIPIEISPRERGNTGGKNRCCIYKERAVTKYKTFPYLGYSVKEEKDELDSLSFYAALALNRKREKKSGDILTVVDEACTSCVKVNYVVSNLCRGCVAKSCHATCPKDAVSFKMDGKAEIDHTKCINCGRCQKACPFRSIVYVPVPCEEVCPVDAISKDDNGIEHIDESKCIYCGKCLVACPFGSIFEISDIIDILNGIKKGDKIIAIPAPSVMGQFTEPAAKVISAIKQLGFHDVIEVAEGATTTTNNETAELLEKIEEGQPFMTTSCCPSYVEAVKKHVKELLPYVSHTGSPMYYTAEIAKKRYPDAKVVFIGPCIAKRKEARDNPNVDFILSFEELKVALESYDIDVAAQEGAELDNISIYSRKYGESGGVANAIIATGVKLTQAPHLINGIDKSTIRMFKTYPKGKNPSNFIEVMSCEGGCIGGPTAALDVLKGKRQMKKSVDAIK